MKKCFLSICSLIILSSSVSAQYDGYHEHKDDDYLPPVEEFAPRQKGYSVASDSIFTIQVNTDEFGNNIPNDAANEPSLGIDPTNPDRMVIGWRQFDNISSNFRQAGLATSLDNGLSWDNRPPIEAGIFRSDPVLCTDSEGKFYYNSLTSPFACDVFGSEDLEDWREKTFAFGGDKQWMVIDNTDTPSNGNIYAFWKAQLSACTGHFTRSVDNGESYEDCTFVDNDPIRGTLAVGPEGEVYACGEFGATYYVLRSDSAKDPASAVQWEAQTTVDLKGRLAMRAGPNPSGMLGQVWVAVDHSENDTRGNVYLLAPTLRSDNGDVSDMMFSSSTDNGVTWTEAISINTDNSIDNWQWFGSLSVAPNGRIDVTWLDTRDNPGTVLSSLYYSYSMDGGQTWSENRRMSEAFDPHVGWPQQNKIGDYFHMISEDAGAHLAWTATFNGEQDVYYSFIPFEEDVSSVSSPLSQINGLTISPNPASSNFEISFSSKFMQKAQVTIISSNSQIMVEQSLDIKVGDQQMLVDVTDWEQGLYYVQLQTQHWSELRKVLIVK